MPEDEDQDVAAVLPPPLMASPIQPIVEETSEDLDTTAEEVVEENTTTNNVFDSENPWDLVPDQPAKLDAINPWYHSKWRRLLSEHLFFFE